jgi:hypothetical protein
MLLLPAQQHSSQRTLWYMYAQTATPASSTLCCWLLARPAGWLPRGCCCCRLLVRIRIPPQQQPALSQQPDRRRVLRLRFASSLGPSGAPCCCYWATQQGSKDSLPTRHVDQWRCGSRKLAQLTVHIGSPHAETIPPDCRGGYTTGTTNSQLQVQSAGRSHQPANTNRNENR